MELLIAPLMMFLAATFISVWLFYGQTENARARLLPYVGRSQAQLAKSGSFSRRVVLPLLERMGRLAGSAAPREAQQRAATMLDMAALPLSPQGFLAVRAIGMVTLPAAYLLALSATHRMIAPPQVLLCLAVGYVGCVLPKLWLSRRVSARQKAIERALPDALDLIVVSMEAGLALDGAIAKVVEKGRGPLKDELQRTLSEVQLGKARRDALKDLGNRTGVPDLITLMNAVVQADQMGVAMADLMRTQADEARIKRRQRAEERAHQAGVKMVFPLVLFILPCVIVVTAGPAALMIYHQISHGFLAH